MRLISRDCVAKLFCPSERAVDVVAKSPPQHRTRASKPRKVTRKKPVKNAMPSASERPLQSFLSVRYSEVHWPSGWSLRTSPDQIARLQISRESVHRLFQARRLLAQSSQCQVLRPLAPRCIPVPPTDDPAWFVVDDSRDCKTVWGRWHEICCRCPTAKAT